MNDMVAGSVFVSDKHLQAYNVHPFLLEQSQRAN